MKENHREYFEALKELFQQIIATDKETKTSMLEEAMERAIQMILKQASGGRKIIIIGNGGSAAIASHIATDFWKNAGVRALSFNDGSLLTCIGNDYGYPEVFAKPIEAFADPGDILIAISSSGKSENILRGVSTATQKGLKVITLSGFDTDNPLRKLGDINFYVPVAHYGYVEIIHLCLCHFWVDTIIKNKLKSAEKVKAYE